MTDSVRETLYPNLIGCGDSADAADSTAAVVPEAPLARAIAYLGAVEVAPGRYAFQWCSHKWCHGKHAPTWYVGDRAYIVDLVDYRDVNEENVVEMPVWWTPERQFAVKTEGGATVPYRTLDNALSNAAAVRCHRLYREDTYAVTADLTTGEEVPA